MNIGIPSIAIDTSHTLPLSSEMHIASSIHLAFLFFTNVKHDTRISTLSKKPNNPHCRGSPSTSGVSFVDENFIERSLDRVQSKRWKRERERGIQGTAREFFRFIVRWSSSGGSCSVEKAAKGDASAEGSIRWIELFKGRARTGAFYELSRTMAALWPCCVHVLRARAHVHGRSASVATVAPPWMC